MTERKKDVIAHLASTRQDLVAVVRSVAPDCGETPASEGCWSAQEVLSHLVTMEPRICVMVRRMIAGEDIQGSPDFDIHRWNAAQVEKKRGLSIDQLLGELSDSRLATLRLIDELSDADLDKRGIHRNWGEINAEFLLRRIGQHEIDHSREISALLSNQA